ncbi:MAG: S-layer homology domain-containing protein [Oscillospiraceae bacterium]
MKLNRILSLVLTGALCASLLTVPAGAATFSDVTDPEVAVATDLLSSLGIVSGNGSGQYLPDGYFTRAQFCKMALTAMGRGEEAALHAGRVIFSDVTSGWALGYVNAAATAPGKDLPPLMQGKGNGKFEPDAFITYGEAVTVLMRTLGYSDGDIVLTGAWYDGYLSRANTLGLTKGMERKGDDNLTRGEAALLFQNLLFVPTKAENKPFFTVKLGGSVTEPAIILALNATTPDGEKNAIKTSAKTYKTGGVAFSETYRGTRSKLMLDKNEKVLAVLPDQTVTTRTIRVTAEPEARYLKAEQDETVLIKPETPIWQADKPESTYAKEYLSIKPGTLLALSYDVAGNLSYLYVLGDGGDANHMVAKSLSPENPFAAITGANQNFTIYKNGSPAKLSDVREYDVGSYNPSTGALTLSDHRLTGVYANAKPSPASPTHITVMGHLFPVLDCALDDLAKFRVGDPITLLLAANNEVAGAVKPSVLTGSALGVAAVTGSGDEKTATVTLTSGIDVSGTVAMSDSAAKTISGKLVEVSSAKLGELTLRTASSDIPPSSWNLSNGTVGTLKLASGASIYERVGSSKLFPVALKDITVPVIPAKQITYVGKNFNGEVDLLILENVTGDHFSYGFPVMGEQTGGSAGLSYTNQTVTLENHAKENPTLITGVDFASQQKKRVPMGFVADLAAIDTLHKISSWLTLTAANGVGRADFSEGTVAVGSVTFPLASDLDTHCYNATTKTWFDSLDAAKAYATRLTVYYDRPANEGGKIRMVVVE